jgi:2-amino-4-hydroxy-6-hydroxymethyldihydropteridine diphosphokinase
VNRSAPGPARGEVLLGLGANLGDPLEQLRRAIRLLREHLDVLAVSPVYRSEPVGLADQPEFLNVVLRARTELSPRELLRVVLEVERGLGRRRTVRNAPRPIDVDILDHGGRRLTEPGLVLPHPRLHERAFVLRPLRDVAPEWRHPESGRTAGDLLGAERAWERAERVAGPEAVR